MDPEPVKGQPIKSFFAQEKERYVFHFDIWPQSFPERIEIYVEAKTTLEDSLLFAIEKANQKLIGVGVKLTPKIALYKPRLVGKNFKPKTDMPALSLYQKICDLKVAEIAVQVLSKEEAITKIGIIQQQSLEKQQQVQKPEVKQELPKIQNLTLAQKGTEPHTA